MRAVRGTVWIWMRTHLLLLDALVGAGAVVRVSLARVVAAGEEAEADPVRLQAVHAHHHVVVGALQPVQLALHVAQVLGDHLYVVRLRLIIAIAWSIHPGNSCVW